MTMTINTVNELIHYFLTFYKHRLVRIPQKLNKISRTRTDNYISFMLSNPAQLQFSKHNYFHARIPLMSIKFDNKYLYAVC